MTEDEDDAMPPHAARAAGAAAGAPGGAPVGASLDAPSGAPMRAPMGANGPREAASHGGAGSEGAALPAGQEAGEAGIGLADGGTAHAAPHGGPTEGDAGVPGHRDVPQLGIADEPDLGGSMPASLPGASFDEYDAAGRPAAAGASAPGADAAGGVVPAPSGGLAAEAMEAPGGGVAAGIAGAHEEDETAPAGGPDQEPEKYSDGEATTIVAGGSAAWERGVHPEDEATTVLTGAAPSWEPGVRPEDEATTVLPGAKPAWEPGVHPEDEATTVLPGAKPAWEPGVHPEDEATTVVHAPAAAWEPGVHPDDEATTVVSAPAPAWEPGLHPHDEATTIVNHGPAAVRGTDEANSAVAAPAQLEDRQGGPDGPSAAAYGGFHGVLPAGRPADEGSQTLRGPADTTTVMGGFAPGEAVPGQGWFDARLQEFAAALNSDEHGQPREREARQMLGAAARDMIARTVMQGGAVAGQEWAADTVLQPDQLLANTYIVRSLIARGGIGEIYRVRHRDLKTEHAVKILLPRYALDPTLLSLMLEEARLLQCVRHEAVVGCQGLLRDADGRPVLVMDYVRGRTLSGRLRDGPLGANELIVLARRLAEGLSAIHTAGIVHQDMSPDNVMLAEDSVAAATIIDFGLARKLGSAAHRNLDFAGKFSWASPEQLSGRPGEVDARSDLYSLGLILMAAARGYRLDMGHDMESARAARRTVPSLAGIEPPVAAVLQCLLHPNKTGRPKAASDIAEMLAPKKQSLLEKFFKKKR